MKKSLYSYSGIVMSFETIICYSWKGQTYAVSENKARNNLTFQFKNQNNFKPSKKIALPDRVVKEY